MPRCLTLHYTAHECSRISFYRRAGLYHSASRPQVCPRSQLDVAKSKLSSNLSLVSMSLTVAPRRSKPTENRFLPLPSLHLCLRHHTPVDESVTDNRWHHSDSASAPRRHAANIKECFDQYGFPIPLENGRDREINDAETLISRIPS